MPGNSNVSGAPTMPVQTSRHPLRVLPNDVPPPLLCRLLCALVGLVDHAI